jgi:hypothetical protein
MFAYQPLNIKTEAGGNVFNRIGYDFKYPYLAFLSYRIIPQGLVKCVGGQKRAML